MFTKITTELKRLDFNDYFPDHAREARRVLQRTIDAVKSTCKARVHEQDLFDLDLDQVDELEFKQGDFVVYLGDVYLCLQDVTGMIPGNFYCYGEEDLFFCMVRLSRNGALFAIQGEKQYPLLAAMQSSRDEVKVNEYIKAHTIDRLAAAQGVPNWVTIYG